MVKIDDIRSFTKRLTLIRLLCTFPVKWNKQLQKYEELPLKWFYFCCLTILTIIMCVAGVYIFIENINNFDIKTALELSQLAVSLIIIFYFYFTKEKLVVCMNAFADIDKRMRILGATINYRAVKIFSIIKYVSTFTCILINNIVCIIFTNQNYMQCTVYFVTYNLTFMIPSSVLSHFCTFILVAMKRLKTLNSSIANLVLKGKQNRKNRDMFLYNEHDTAKSLRYISVIHWDIIKLTKLVNKTFALQLVLMFFKTFVTLLAAIHSIVKKQTGMLVIYDLFWSFFTVLEVIYMLQVCTECIKLSKSSTHLVNILHTKNDSKLKFEKEMFLLQCLHQKLDFTALGLFSINKSVFLKFCAAVVTYAILIMQFESLKTN